MVKTISKCGVLGFKLDGIFIFSSTFPTKSIVAPSIFILGICFFLNGIQSFFCLRSAVRVYHRVLSFLFVAKIKSIQVTPTYLLHNLAADFA